jgi:hypothetical protein
VSALDVAGEDPRRETELGGVGAGDHLLLAVEGEHAHDRSEDLLTGDPHLVETSTNTVGCTKKPSASSGTDARPPPARQRAPSARPAST